jgi:hypothetical protein
MTNQPHSNAIHIKSFDADNTEQYLKSVQRLEALATHQTTKSRTPGLNSEMAE